MSGLDIMATKVHKKRPPGRFKKVTKRKVVDGCALITSGEHEFKIRQYAPLGPGDLVRCHGKSIKVYLKESEVEISVSPAWKRNFHINIGGEDLKITIKEVETEEEMDGYTRLTHYHYRGNRGVARAIPLVAKLHIPELPEVVGFIEITSSLLANSARSRLFDGKFSDPKSGIAWIRWDAKTKKKYGNVVGRISRCVVFPELRGVGLSTLLTKAAIKYCKERWHIAGMKPTFLEITADMLRYNPFVVSSGFEYIGETNGNSDRLIKDMQYLLKRYCNGGKRNLPKGGGGIMALQISYAESLKNLMDETKRSLPEIVDMLKKEPEKLSDDEWLSLHKVHRHPKPNYMIGLTESANSFIISRKRALGIGSPTSAPSLSEKHNSGSNTVINIDKIDVSAKPSGSQKSRSVQESFGFVSRDITTSIVKELNLHLQPTDICLISGPSGSGKSIVLSCIHKLLLNQKYKLPSHVSLNAGEGCSLASCSIVKKPNMTHAPIDQFKGMDMETIMHLLSIAGLAEPNLYVRPASSLSEGQKYRLALAIALAKGPDFLIADAFCESLDRFSTIAVSSGIRKASKRHGFGCIFATARHEYVQDHLEPDINVYLSSTDEVKVVRNGC